MYNAKSSLYNTLRQMGRAGAGSSNEQITRGWHKTTRRCWVGPGRARGGRVRQTERDVSTEVWRKGSKDSIVGLFLCLFFYVFTDVHWRKLRKRKEWDRYVLLDITVKQEGREGGRSEIAWLLGSSNTRFPFVFYRCYWRKLRNK